MEEVRLWKKMAAAGLLKKGQSIGCRREERNADIDGRQEAQPQQERRRQAARPEQESAYFH